MHFLSSAPPGSAWTFGGSILTFALPMILFIAVGGALWILYTKPELVPGRWAGNAERPVSSTPMPHQPAAAAGAATAPEHSAAASAAGVPAAPEDSAASASRDAAAAAPEGSEAATTGDAE